MTTDFVTCKINFRYGTTEAEVRNLLGKYTDNFSIANFYPDKQIGCNQTTFGVFDIPRDIITKLVKENTIKDIDSMANYSRQSSKLEECSGGG